MSIGKLELTDISKEQKNTVPGMAHFGGTGPQYTYCSGCSFLFEQRLANYCRKYKEMMGRLGKPISPSNKSCRYYTEKK